jgi:hypothetical protein
MENRISFQLTEADKEDIKAALKVLGGTLLPKLVELTPDEIRELPTMGDRSSPFTTKALEFAKIYPEYAALIDVTEFEKDMKTVEQLREIYIPLAQLTKNVHDTMTLAGSEAYVAGLTYYGSAKEGLKRKLPNAIRITEDLGQRFLPNRSKAKKVE